MDIVERLLSFETIAVLIAATIATLTAGARRLWHATRHAGGGHLIHIAAPPEVDARGAARLWLNLAGIAAPGRRRVLLGQSHVSFEYAWNARSLDIRIWTPPRVSAALVTAAVTAAWPGATAIVSDADAPIPADALALGRVMTFGTDAIPMTTDQDVEPLRALMAAADAGSHGERSIVQVLARPASRRRQARLRRCAHGVRGSSISSMLIDTIDPSSGRARTPHRHSDALTRSAQQRCGSTMFEMTLRYAVATSDTRSGKPARNRLAERAARIAAAMGVFAGPAGSHRHGLARPATVTASRRFEAGGKLVTVEELAALAHVPADERLAQVERAGAVLVPPVAAIASGGRGAKTLGTAAVGGRRISLSAADARHHLHVVGSTGVGKSTLLANLVLSDIKARRGVVVIDPKGDLVTDVLNRLNPADVAGRVHIIDPDQQRGSGINPLTGGDTDLVVDHFVGICRRIWERHWGPRADDVMRSALLTLLSGDGKASLERLPTLLGDRKGRAPITASLRGPLAEFWQWFDQLSPGVQAQAAGPVLSRIRAMLMRRFVRDTIGSPARDINIRDVLDHAGILLVRLPKGQIGDDTARLLGSIVVARTWQAASGRTTIPEADRRDASLYVDECHNFLTLPRALDEILAEARAFKLSLVMAHQHMAQLPREMTFAISANARTKVFFDTSPEDARLLARHTVPHLSEHDLCHLDAFTAACRPFTAGRQQSPFTLATLPPVSVIGEADVIRRDATPPPGPKDGSDDGELPSDRRHRPQKKPTGATAQTEASTVMDAGGDV